MGARTVQAKLSSKGQVTLPKDVRRRLGLKTGDTIEFIEEPEGYRIYKRVISSPFDAYVGYLKDLAGRDPDEIVREMRGE